MARKQTQYNGPMEAIRCKVAAVAIGIAPQVIFDWLRRGRVTGKQLAKGIDLAEYLHVAIVIPETPPSCRSQASKIY